MSVLGRSLFVYEVSGDFWHFFYQALSQRQLTNINTLKIKNVTTNVKATDENEKNFKILVWKFGHWAKRKYVNGYTSKAKDFFANCSVR